MWFLKGTPQNISFRLIIKSVQNGYQQVTYRFKISATATASTDFFIGIAVPWAPHKKNGGIKLTDAICAFSSEEDEKNILLTDKDIHIYENPRKLKQEYCNADIKLINLQELCNWYLDDMGIITFFAHPDTWYELNYIHKIASNSCLFIPAKLPSVVSYVKRPVIDFKLWIINGLNTGLSKWLQKSASDYYTIKNNYEWDEDFWIHTNNWDSSDDE